MKLLTKEIEKSIPKLYATESVPAEEKKLAVKFFTPDANWSWYAIEGEKQENGDWLFFGLVDGLEREWGYFSLSELESVRGGFGLPVERDMYIGNPLMKDVIDF